MIMIMITMIDNILFFKVPNEKTITHVYRYKSVCINRLEVAYLSQILSLRKKGNKKGKIKHRSLENSSLSVIPGRAQYV